MWSREELKQNSKEFLKKFFIQSIVVCTIFSIFQFDSNFFDYTKSKTSTVVQENGIYNNFPRYIRQVLGDGSDFFENSFFSTEPIKSIFENINIIVLIVILLIITIFVSAPITIGLKRFFINGYRNDEVRMSDMFTVFTDGNYISYSLKMMYLRIILILWTLLFLIPGMYKSYQYFYVPYILSDNPNCSVKDALMLSKEMTEGKKLDIFILDLSFILWRILCIFTLGI